MTHEIHFSDTFFGEVATVAYQIDTDNVENLIKALAKIKGRLFVLGVGGSAGNASHMVNDLRKLCNIEAYAPTDNVSELTARTNDDGFETIFDSYLKVSRLNEHDALFVLSVGGGNEERNVSVGLINAIKYAKDVNAKVFGIVGKADGYTAQHGDNVVVVPQINSLRVTPHSEAFQAVVWHCIVSHPLLQMHKTKW